MRENELKSLVSTINKIKVLLKSFKRLNGSYHSDKRFSPIEDTQYALFVINILEDITQDILFYYDSSLDLTPISKIFEDVRNIDKSFLFVSR